MGGDGQALFRESDNLESLYAKAALRRFYIALWRGNIPGWSLDRFEDATGLKLVHEGNLKEDLPPMPRFLNRLLALPIDEQNQLFAELEERIAANIEQAMEAGAYEVGVETVRADSLAIAGREPLYEHPGTGAVTELVEILRRDKLEPLAADVALEIGAREPGPDKPAPPRGWRSTPARSAPPSCCRRRRACSTTAGCRSGFAWSGRPHAIPWRGPSSTPPTGARPTRRTGACSGSTRSPSCPRTGSPASGSPPDCCCRSGTGCRPRTCGCAGSRPTTGEPLIGRVLDAEQVAAVRTAFGLDGALAMTGAEAFEAVMGRGSALALANGWRLARRRIMGADRIEIEGPADTDTALLKRIGCTVEIVSWRARAFAPGAEVLDRVLERWPLAA